MIPVDYHNTSCCGTCSRVRVEETYDSGSYYYCSIDGVKMPKITTSILDNDEQWRKEKQELFSWEQTRQVYPWGLCSKYRKSKATFLENQMNRVKNNGGKKDE